jgi:7-cyano-7-deazaguanine synthase in queuosine biosynthesis
VVEGGAKPVLVSHHPAPVLDRRQQVLIGHLRRLMPQWYFPQVSILVNKAKSQARDASQRTRSFLFASLGAGIADALGVEDVILADNGVVSINLPVNDQLVGALASRSTHPKFIGLFNRLVSRVLESKPVVSNTFWNRTRADALEVLKRAQVPQLLQESNSCSRSRGLPNVTPHCGTCSQCIDRRFATITACMEEHDLPERYRTDVFRDALQGDGLTLAESYVRFARNVYGLSEEQLFDEYPQLNDCILPEDPRPDVTAQELAGMIKRHAGEILWVMEEQVSKARSDLVKHTLPATCLIQIAVIRDKVPFEEVVPQIRLAEAEEQELKRQRFNSRLVIQLTGETEPRKSNVVRIDEAEVLLPDSLFRLFLRLAVALHESPDGFLSRETLKYGEALDSESALAPEGLDQAISRLRALVRPALKGLDAKKLIEVSRGRVRLSTYNRYVLVDREHLLGHPDEVVRLLAERLPTIRLGRRRVRAPA